MKRANPFLALAESDPDEVVSDDDSSHEDEPGSNLQAAAARAVVTADPRSQKKATKKQRKEQRRSAARTDQPSAQHLERRAITLVKGSKPSKNLSGVVSEAFEVGRWGDALVGLAAMRSLRQVPKLGSVQRWVASLGDGASTDPTALGLLSAILHVASGLGVALGASAVPRGPPATKGGPQTSPLPVKVTPAGSLRLLPDWEAVPLREGSGVGSGEGAAEGVEYGARFRVAATITGPARTPPNVYDLNMFEPREAGVLGLASSREPCGCMAVPFAPGALVLTNLLSPAECAAFIAASNQCGYVPDQPATARSAESLVIWKQHFPGYTGNRSWPLVSSWGFICLFPVPCGSRSRRRPLEWKSARPTSPCSRTSPSWCASAR